MALPPLPTVTLTPVAFFPQWYFPENLAVRADGSILITELVQKTSGAFLPQSPG